MNNTLNIPSTEDLAKRGSQIYEEIKSTIEQAHDGHYVAIEVESKKYFIDITAEKAIESAKGEFPDRLFFVRRIGGTTHISVRSLQNYERVL